MEASQQNRRTVAAKIADLYARYPLNKYVWIMPSIDTASELPEHLDLVIQTRKFSSNEKDGDVYPQKGGGLSLRKSAIMALASDAGIKWHPHDRGRVDDKSDPDIIEWKETALLVGLSGWVNVPATKRIDFAHSRRVDEEVKKYKPQKVVEEDLRRKEFGLENAESKAQLRAIRSILGIPHKFEKATIDSKSFATLRIIFVPHATNDRERILIINRLSDMYLGAYPGAEVPGGAPQIAAAEEPIQIAPHEVRTALPAADSEPGGRIPAKEVPSSSLPPGIPLAEVIDNGNGEPPDEPPPVNYEFLKAMGELKKEFVKLLGSEEGELEYYAPIHELGLQKSNQIVDEADQKAVYRTLATRLKLLQENAGQVAEEAADAPPVNDMWQFKMLRAELGKRSIDELKQSLLGYTVEYKYDGCVDPQGLKALLDKETKGNLIEAHIRIMRESKK